MNRPIIDSRHMEQETVRIEGSPIMVATGNGNDVAPCCCASGVMITLAGPGATIGPKHIGILALFLGGAGIYVPLSADRLRNMATGLLRAADAIDQGKGKQ